MRPFPALRRILRPAVLLAAVLLVAGCAGSDSQEGAGGGDRPAAASPTPKEAPAVNDTADSPAPQGTAPGPATEVATFGAGCFWCVEAVLEQLDGVTDVQSGFMGGTVKDPTYREVCTGTTGHAEVVQVTFDPARITYDDLLDWFWRLHDPTTPNRQGHDVGTQYRSAIFHHSPEQKAAAERSRDAAQASFPDPIVTEITPASKFWSAEQYHQDYYRLNASKNPYCQVVIAPKLKKLGLEK